MVTIINDETELEKIANIDKLVLITKLKKSKLNKALIDFQHDNVLSTFEYEKLRAVGKKTLESCIVCLKLTNQVFNHDLFYLLLTHITTI